MTNEELISKIKAEIERLKGYYRITNPYDKRAIRVCENLLSFLSTLESEKPMNPDDAMKELDEKIALVKQRGTWDGVDVDKYMDEVRGRVLEKPVPKDLEEAARNYALNTAEDSEQYSARYLGYKDGATWQKEQDDKELSEKIASAYQLGLADKEKMMMKEAVEGTYNNSDWGTPCIDLPSPLELERFDKVKIIIVKED